MLLDIKLLESRRLKHNERVLEFNEKYPEDNFMNLFISDEYVLDDLTRVIGLENEKGFYNERVRLKDVANFKITNEYDSFYNKDNILELCRNGIELRDNYGVCDNIEQILKEYPELNGSETLYIVGLYNVDKKSQPFEGGWRWHKNGKYIGELNPQCEYLSEEADIDRVYVYHIYEVEEIFE